LGRLAKSLAVTGALVIIVLLALISNLGVQTSRGKGLTVIASFFPLYDWTLNVVGSKATVVNLTPPGMDPHDLDPTPKDLSLISSSNVFVYSGAGMEPWVTKVLPIIDRASTVVVDVSAGMEIIRDYKGNANPHFWLDPTLAIIAVENIELGTEQADPANAGYYRQNAQNYMNRLTGLHQAFLKNLTSVRIRIFITFHEAFAYWKKTYNITEAGVYGFEPEGEPSAAHMQDLVNLAKRYGITTVLASNLDDPHWCQVLADQIGGRVLILDPLEGPTLEQYQAGNYTYTSRMYRNIAVLKEALI
jgi:zinc transport system substrate-binding protein